MKTNQNFLFHFQSCFIKLNDRSLSNLSMDFSSRCDFPVDFDVPLPSIDWRTTVQSLRDEERDVVRVHRKLFKDRRR